MEAIALSSINYVRLQKNSLKVSGWASSQGNIKCFKDLKDFQSSTPESYCIGTLMTKTKAKEFSGLSQVSILQCSFFQHPEPYSLINLNAVLFSGASGL